MEENPFLSSLGLVKETDPDFDRVERAFLDQVKARIQLVQDNYDDEEVKKSEKWLVDFHQQFFDYSLQWIIKQAKAQQKVKNHPEAANLKRDARKVLADLQKGIVDFASCYMHINRFTTIIRDEIKHEETRGFFMGSKGTKWTADTGVMINRYKKRKRQIKQQEQNREKARDVLAQIDIDAFKSNVIALYGREKGDGLQRRFISSLRVGDFKKAEKTLKEIEGTKKKFTVDKKAADTLAKDTMSQGHTILVLVSVNQDILSGEGDRLFLKAEELNVVEDSNKKEVQKMDVFLAKYHLPYMQYKLDSLQHLRDRLLVVGSLESLLTLYKKIIVGIAKPIPDIKALRLFENEALERVNYLLEGHFQDVAKIHEWAEQAVDEFRKNREEFKEIEKTIFDESGQIAPAIASQSVT